MFHLSEDSLDFALTHVIARGDTDILPPAHDFQAIFHDLARVRSDLSGKDLDMWWLVSSGSMHSHHQRSQSAVGLRQKEAARRDDL
jgi:hypothetical protein